MKQSPFILFAVKLSLLSAVLFGMAYYMSGSGYIGLSRHQLAMMFIILFIITLLSFYIVMQSAQKSPRTFTYAFMFSSTIRLLVYGVFIALYCHWRPQVAMPFAVTFFVLYMIYTGFEIGSLLGFLKQK
jgi:hypothetical protein